MRKHFREKLTSLIISSLIKCQRFVRKFVCHSLRKRGLVYSRLVLDGHREALKVKIFGEFSKQPWGQKLECRRNQKDWDVFVWIRFGQKFKFCLDDGDRYAVSSQF